VVLVTWAVPPRVDVSGSGGVPHKRGGGSEDRLVGAVGRGEVAVIVGGDGEAGAAGGTDGQGTQGWVGRRCGVFDDEDVAKSALGVGNDLKVDPGQDGWIGGGGAVESRCW
jgi:hypothetical protein